MSSFRFTIYLRLLVGMLTLVALSTTVAVSVQEHTLSRDLERAANDRLDGATDAARNLLRSHRQRVLARHRVLARTPEFRANLATAHVPTLSRLAEDLMRREPELDAVLFTNSKQGLVASSGDTSLVNALAAHSPFIPLCSTGCEEALASGESFLIEQASTFAIGTSIPLFLENRSVGTLRSVETVKPAVLEEWSQLIAGKVEIVSALSPLGRFEAVVSQAGANQLRVQMSFQAEQRALARLRKMLGGAGILAIAFSFVIAIPLSRRLLSPLRQIEEASLRISNGDLTVRLPARQDDEIGDVSRAFNSMLERIESSQAELERAQRIGRLGGWSQAENSLDIEMTREMCSILGIPPTRGPVDSSRVLDHVHRDDVGPLEAAVRACRERGTPFSLDFRVVRDDGSVRVVHGHGERCVGSDGKTRLEGTIQDVTERKRAEEQVRTLAYEDGLTGLGNRRDFGETLHRSLVECRKTGQPLAVLFLDLDDFKLVNDTLGHRAGDDLLRVVAERIKDALDALGGTSQSPSVHRLGGDEFAVILPELESADVPLQVAQEILSRFLSPVVIDGGEVDVTVSIGISRWPDEGEDSESLLRGCDTAMYAAKQDGRGCYRVYDASMRDSLERRLDVATGLRKAISEGQLQVHYQPKVDLKTGGIGGLEALLRWNDPTLGVISPDEFIRVAEQTGQILALGEWVLRDAIHQARAWSDAEVACGPISVNVSSTQINAGVVVDTTSRLLSEAELDPSLLELEITENGLLGDERQAIQVLKELKALGIALSLDDFGTGYSSLSYLRRLPIDTVKIDRSFVSDIDTDPQDYAFVASIVSMANVLGLHIVAEGVENDQQRELLSEMGCHMIQGFLYGPPLPGDDVPAFLAGWKPKRRRRRASSKPQR